MVNMILFMITQKNFIKSLANHWMAYDGNPIYGPYGFTRNDGGTIRRLIPDMN